MIPKSHTAVFQALAAAVERMNEGKALTDEGYLPFAYNEVEVETGGYIGAAEVRFNGHDEKQPRTPPKNFLEARILLRYMRTPKVWICEKVEINNRYFVLTWDGADIAAIEEIFRPTDAQDIPRWYGENWF